MDQLGIIRNNYRERVRVHEHYIYIYIYRDNNVYVLSVGMDLIGKEHYIYIIIYLHNINGVSM